MRQNTEVRLLFPSPFAHCGLNVVTARLAEREQIMRESWVRTMEAKLTRDQLDRCYQTEGVNHMESCKELRERYLDMLRDNRVRVPCFRVRRLCVLTASPNRGLWYCR